MCQTKNHKICPVILNLPHNMSDNTKTLRQKLIFPILRVDQRKIMCQVLPQEKCFKFFLRALSKKFRKATISFVMSVYPSVRPPAWNNSASNKRIFMKFDI